MIRAQVADTTKKDWSPSFFLVGVDVIAPLSSFSPDILGFEVGASVDFYDYWFLHGELGSKTRTRSFSYDYESSGTYYRIGFMRNILTTSRNENILGFGLNYAESAFTNKLYYLKSNDFYMNIENDLEDEGVRARWLELTGTLNVRIWKQLYFGYTIRYKFLKQISNEDEIETYDIPGYGRNKKSGTEFKNSNFGLNYYLIWKLKFREKQTKMPE